MARKKKRDFWDDVEDDFIPQEDSKSQHYSDEDQSGYTEDYEDEGFRMTRSMPVKIIARILLCAAAIVIGLSGLVFFRYVDDRHSNGTYTTNLMEKRGWV